MTENEIRLDSIAEGLADIGAGRMIVLVDDENRENEGDLVMAAQFVTPEAINFMVTHARGLVCLTLAPELAERLQLKPMVPTNASNHGTAFTVSIEAAEGVSTGISAADRAHTVRVAVSPDCRPEDIVSPGHVFPLTARSGGVLVRAGHTEGSVDMAHLNHLNPAGVICEIMNSDGSMSRLPDLRRFADAHGFKLCSIADLIGWRMARESLVRVASQATLPTRYGKDFKVLVFDSPMDKASHVALVMGDIRADEPTLVRVHSECLTGDVFGSLRCDCGDQLAAAMEQISREGKGVLVYLRQEGRGIGLENKIKAYSLQDEGLDTVDANKEIGFPPDLRTYGIGAQIMRAVGIGKFRLLTNNPRKIIGLDGFGLEFVGREPIEIAPNSINSGYLRTKRDRMGHLLSLSEREEGGDHG